MRDIQDKQLDFVAHHFRAGAFDARRAWRRLRRARAGRHPAPAWGYALALTGAVAILVAGILLFRQASNAWTRVPEATVAQTVILPDSTHATLAPGASLSFHRRAFGRRDRTVRMDGKIYFAVAHDRDLPFEITPAEGGFVRVLGTRFQIETSPGGTAVDVVDGRVLFVATPDGADEAYGLVLTEGMHATLAPGADRPQVTAPSSPNPAAWATRSFRYVDTPLAEVLQELSAHFGRTLTTDQPARRLTGEFEGDELGEIIALIEEALDLTINTK